MTAGLCFSAGNNTPLKVSPSKVLNSTASRDASILCELISLDREPGTVGLSEPIEENKICQLQSLAARGC